MSFTLRLLPERLAICRLAADHAVPVWLGRLPFWSATRTADELSLVVPERLAHEEWRQERGWRALTVVGPLDLAMVGVLAELAGLLAAAGVSVFALGTFDTDLLLVRDSALGSATEALEAAGHRVER